MSVSRSKTGCYAYVTLSKTLLCMSRVARLVAMNGSRVSGKGVVVVLFFDFPVL